MKAVKTIVATAVIVFALTTVAMAGVQHLGDGGGSAAPASSTPAGGQHDSVTLSAQQFAALLHAVARERSAGGATAPTSAARHSHAQAGTHARTHTHAPTHAHAATHAHATAQTQQHSVQATHHTATHTGTHDGGGTHERHP